ncbi:Arc family DNA-binding protein [Pseudomonas sp.]
MSRVDPQVVVRMPENLKAWLKEQAKANRRSQNAEIVYRLEKAKSQAEAA